MRKLREPKNPPWSHQCLSAQLQVLFHLAKDTFYKCKLICMSAENSQPESWSLISSVPRGQDQKRGYIGLVLVTTITWELTFVHSSGEFSLSWYFWSCAEEGYHGSKHISGRRLFVWWWAGREEGTRDKIPCEDWTLVTYFLPHPSAETPLLKFLE